MYVTFCLEIETSKARYIVDFKTGGYKKEQRESYTVKYIYLADIHISHIRKKVENISPKQVSDDYQGNSPSYSLLYAYMVPTHLLWILLPDEQVGEDKA